ncbi:MAG TPA: type II toxin-antitoxin system HicB family antitoxin [Ignavibacteria bacterium]
MKQNVFDIIVHEADEGGYWGECPSFDGCYSQGETLDELQNNMKEAIELYLETLENHKKQIPQKHKVFIIPVMV